MKGNSWPSVETQATQLCGLRLHGVSYLSGPQMEKEWEQHNMFFEGGQCNLSYNHGIRVELAERPEIESLKRIMERKRL